MNFSSAFIRRQNNLEKELEERGIIQDIITKVLESGYVSGSYASGLRFNESNPCVLDCYYGNKYSGLIDYDTFVNYLNGKESYHQPDIQKYHVKSIREVRKILALPEFKHFKGRICFRGQTREHWMKRSIPNPFASNPEGKERFIALSFWRQCL